MLIFKNYLLSKRSGALVRIIAWHCILGVGMGVAALLTVLSVMNGFNLTIRSRMLSLEPHLVLGTKERPSREQLKELQNRLKGVAALETIDRFEAQDLIIRSQEGAFGGALAKGYDYDTLESLLARTRKNLSRSDREEPAFELSNHLSPNEVILGVDLARGLGLFEGDEILLVPPETLLLPKGEMPRLQKFKIRALVSTQIPDIDSKVMFYQLNPKGQRVRSLSLDTGIEIRLVDPYQADNVKQQLGQMGYSAQTWTERDTSLFYSLRMESFLMALFLTLAVLITSFSIVTVMVLLMNQKRKDIGLFQSLGLSLRRTRVVFFRVGMMLSGVGIAGGALIGTTVCLLLDRYPLEILPDVYTDTTLPAKLTPGIFTFVLLSSCLIAVLGSWLPVWRYALSQPSDSLRKVGGQ